MGNLLVPQSRLQKENFGIQTHDLRSTGDFSYHRFNTGAMPSPSAGMQVSMNSLEMEIRLRVKRSGESKPMKPICTLAILICGSFCALAATDSMPAPSNIVGADYPRITSDLSVTFRLKAPNAKQVKLEGGAGLIKEPIDLARGEDGVWTVTTPAAVPGFHYYWFVLDGLRVNDPSSYSWFGWGRESSGIEIPEPGVDFYTAKQDVPHGEVRAHWYFSKITDKWRRAHVYTPPDYDRSARARFPV